MEWINVKDKMPPPPEKRTKHLCFLTYPRGSKKYGLYQQIRIGRWEPYKLWENGQPTGIGYRWEFDRSVGGYENINKWSGYVTHWCEIPNLPGCKQ